MTIYPTPRSWKIWLMALMCLAPLLVLMDASEANIGRFLANNRSHRIRFVQATAQFREAIRWTVRNDYQGTVLTVRFVSGGEDVRVITRRYGNVSWEALTVCPLAYMRLRACDRFTVKLNLSAGPFSTRRIRQVACHEIGHTVGLKHTRRGHPGHGKSCMHPVAAHLTRLSRHDRRHINRTY